MLKLLDGIDKRAKYLDRALPQPTVLVTFPDEDIFKPYVGMRVPLSALTSIEKMYAPTGEVGDLPVVAMVREAAISGVAHAPNYDGILNALIAKEEARVGPAVFEAVRNEIRGEARQGRW